MKNKHPSYGDRFKKDEPLRKKQKEKLLKKIKKGFKQFGIKSVKAGKNIIDIYEK